MACSAATPAAPSPCSPTIRHKTVDLKRGERVHGKNWHIQNANAHHGRL
jgi:hypothetical protein